MKETTIDTPANVVLGVVNGYCKRSSNKQSIHKHFSTDYYVKSVKERAVVYVVPKSVYDENLDDVSRGLGSCIADCAMYDVNYGVAGNISKALKKAVGKKGCNISKKIIHRAMAKIGGIKEDGTISSDMVLMLPLSRYTTMRKLKGYAGEGCHITGPGHTYMGIPVCYFDAADIGKGKNKVGLLAMKSAIATKISDSPLVRPISQIDKDACGSEIKIIATYISGFEIVNPDMGCKIYTK